MAKFTVKDIDGELYEIKADKFVIYPNRLIFYKGKERIAVFARYASLIKKPGIS